MVLGSLPLAVVSSDVEERFVRAGLKSEAVSAGNSQVLATGESLTSWRKKLGSLSGVLGLLAEAPSDVG